LFHNNKSPPPWWFFAWIPFGETPCTVKLGTGWTSGVFCSADFQFLPGSPPRRVRVPPQFYAAAPGSRRRDTAATGDNPPAQRPAPSPPRVSVSHPSDRTGGPCALGRRQGPGGGTAPGVETPGIADHSAATSYASRLASPNLRQVWVIFPVAVSRDRRTDWHRRVAMVS